MPTLSLYALPAAKLEATAKECEALGGEVVKIICLMELAGLKGRDKLSKYDVESVITYEGK